MFFKLTPSKQSTDAHLDATAINERLFMGPRYIVDRGRKPGTKSRYN